ncbi:hypothetical protein [Psychrobacillus sp. L4]|uniref:hypothetical protein n=1 Tax=Psychrobacillus sp. L4 TaxID=3236892 RepID=UPI0036F36B0E
MVDKEQKKTYGQYEIPNEIHLLYQLENDLSNEGLSLSQIGFQPIYQFVPYWITPPDLIAFASTGGGGIHFGFLTDFHSVSNLSEAPIVCVTPTNDPPLRYMARNIREFLNLAYSVPYAEMLETMWNYEDEKQIIELIKEFEKDTSENWKRDREYIQTRYQQVFGTKKLDVVNYFIQVKKERAETIYMTTLDGLGVVRTKPSIKSKQHFNFPSNRNIDEVEIEKMRTFLEHSNETEKLVFVRDAHYRYVVSSGYDEAIWELLLELLISLKLEDEAESVSERC